MNEIETNKLAELLEQMIQDKVQLVHGGQIIEWNDTKIPEIIESIKQSQKYDDSIIESGTLLKNKYTGQKCGVINDKGGIVSMILQGDILTYPKKWIWSHFEISVSGEQKKNNTTKHNAAIAAIEKTAAIAYPLAPILHITGPKFTTSANVLDPDNDK